MSRWSVCIISMTGLACLMLPGCMDPTPDHWQVFQDALDRDLQNQPMHAIDLPSEVIPKPAQPTPLPIMTGDGALKISIEQAALLALSHNRDLAVQQLNPVITGTFEDIERGRYDPEWFASAEYARDKTSETDRATGTQFSTSGRAEGAGTGLRQKLPTGTEVEASVSIDRSISNRTPEQQEARFGLTVTQALLRGYGPAANLATIRQAELETLASKYMLRAFTETLLAETEIACWNHILANARIAIFEQSLAVAKQQLNVVEQRIEFGVLAETEAAAVRSEVARREQALIEARSRREVTRLRLLRLMNPNEQASLNREVEVTTDYAITPKPLTDLDERVRLAMRLRPEINEAQLRLEQNRLQTSITRNGLLPRLDAFLVLGRSGFDNTFADSFRNLNDGNYDFAVGGRFSQYLGNREAEARDRMARASRQQAAESLRNLKQVVRLDVHLAANEVERARQQITATATTRQLEEQTVLAERERFDVGDSTALLVAQAQRDLLLAQITEVESLIGYRVSLVNLYLAEGSLLERRGIHLDTPGNP